MATLALHMFVVLLLMTSQGQSIGKVIATDNLTECHQVEQNLRSNPPQDPTVYYYVKCYDETMVRGGPLQ